MPPNTSYNENMLASRQRQAGFVADDRVRQEMAQMGAQRLAAYGPEGQKWATALMQDPESAMAMAQSYGGMAEIERRLIYSQAAGEGTQAMGDASFGQEGPQGLSQFGTGLKNMRSATEQDLLGQMTDAQRIEYFKSTDPSKAKTLQELTRGYNDESLRAMANRREKYTTEARGVMNQLSSLEAMDPTSPEWEYATTIVINKLLQPDSAVLLAESEAALQGLTTKFTKYSQQVKQTYELTGNIDETARRKLYEMATQLGKKYMRLYETTYDDWDSKDTNVFEFDEGAKEVYNPGRALIPHVRAFLGKDSKPSSSQRKAPAVPSAMSAKYPGFTWEQTPDGWVGTPPSGGK